MMPLHPLSMPVYRVDHDRSSAELRSYLREEYGSDSGWLYARVRSRNPGLRARLRRWARARQTRRERPSEYLPTETSLSPAPLPSLAKAEACPHFLTEDLGIGGGAEFLRCTVCGDVLIAGARGTWRLGRADDEIASLPESRPSEDPICVEATTSEEG